MISNELEHEIINFYLMPNSAREIERKYGINLYQLKKILAKYNISTHSKEATYRLRDERTKEVCLDKYGVTNPFAVEKVKDKIKQTMLERYNVEYVGQAEISKQKSKATCLQNYGVDSYSKTTKFKKDYSANSTKYKLKEFETKKFKGNLNTSKAEELYYQKLINKYGANNIIRQYLDKRYPYHCDFYIISEDLFIELNLSWTHGAHPFNSESIEDLNILKLWQEKAKTSIYYKNAIETWTKRDSLKLETARKNCLNYQAIYNGGYIYEQ